MLYKLLNSNWEVHFLLSYTVDVTLEFIIRKQEDNSISALMRLMQYITESEGITLTGLSAEAKNSLQSGIPSGGLFAGFARTVSPE